MKTGNIISEFKILRTLCVIGITILLLLILTFIAYVWIVDMKEFDLFQRILMGFFPLFALPFIIRIELPKIKRLIIDEDGITFKNPLTGHSKKMNWNEIDGYQNIVHLTREGLLKELILVSNDKVIFELSENYIQNFQAVRKALTRNLKNLGPVDFDYFQFLKDRLFK